MIDNAYKNKRQEDDLNQPLSVQPLGSDSDKRRYFMIEGPEHTSFRIYRESNPAGFQRTWWSVAGSIEDVHALTDKLLTADGGPKARKLGQKLQEQIPHLEESLDVNAFAPLSVNAHLLVEAVLTSTIEVEAPRVPPPAQAAVQAARPRLLAV